MDYKRHFKGKTFFITGGTGSFGNIVVQKLLSYKPKKIIVLSRDEEKQFRMRNTFNNPLLTFIIGDVRDKTSFSKYLHDVDYLFHAAALKQVPTCEFFPLEAVYTNILGTHNVIEAAYEHQVKKVVVLSTDKAVYPINAMGMTKALMEKIMISSVKKISDIKENKTILCGVRYGNVLYSRGSVLPYFMDLIRQKKQLHITNPHMTRFLLRLSDAVDLVFYAMTHGENGDMYVQKSPSASIEILAKAMCTLFDYKIGYVEVGSRAGEKLHETLVSEEEMRRAQSKGKYFRIPPESQGLDYNKYLIKGNHKNTKVEAFTSFNTKQLTVSQTMQLLRTLDEFKKELKK